MIELTCPHCNEKTWAYRPCDKERGGGSCGSCGNLFAVERVRAYKAVRYPCLDGTEEHDEDFSIFSFGECRTCRLSYDEWGRLCVNEDCDSPVRPEADLCDLCASKLNEDPDDEATDHL